MKPHSRLWQRVVEAYRNEDWHDCIRRIRPLVEADPFALSLRQLLARLYIKVGNPRLALLQYERLLPLAIGKRDLFRALAVQKHLDRMQAPDTPHQDRFIAMHRWFCSVGSSSAAGGAESPGGKASAIALLRLPAERFASVAEGCVLEMMDLGPIEAEARPGTCWMITSGRVRWSLVGSEENPAAETTVEEGGSIVLEAGAGDPMRVRLVPELPADCLRFDPEFAAALTGSEDTLAEAPAGKPAAAAAEPAPPVVDAVECEPQPAPALADAPALDAPATASETPGVTQEAGTSAAPEEAVGSPAPAPAAPAPAFVSPPRPMPDRFAEPSIAASAPFERRNETRAAISLHSRVVLLGLAGTRVAPLNGTLVDLTAHGACCRFPKAELTQAREALENAAINLRLILPGVAEPMALVAEVRWADADEQDPAAPDAPQGRVGVEFCFVAEHDRALIREFLERAAADGGRPAAEPSMAKSLDGGDGSA